jgi:AAA+ superfamily predicted ATPase
MTDMPFIVAYSIFLGGFVNSKKLLLLLTLSILPAQLCAMIGGTTKFEVGLSQDFDKDVMRVAKALGTQTNENVDTFMRHIGSGLEKNVAPGIASLGTGGSDALKNLKPGMAAFGEGGANALENVSKALPAIGKNTANMIAPIQYQVILGVAALSALGFATTVAVEYSKKYISKYLFAPKLIEKRSPSWTLLSLLSSKKAVKIEDHMIIGDQLKQKLNYIMKMTKNIKKNGGQFENVLLYGEPGTGKTLFAQLLAEHCGMEYALIPAANVSQFFAEGATSTAAQELNELFAWAAGNSKGTILFFDEAETFLAQDATLPVKARDALSAFKAKTGTPNDKIMIICATNNPQVMDTAVLSRLGFKVEFPLPDLKAREAQLAMHVKKIFATQKGKQIGYALLQNPESLAKIAQQLEGCSGRSIQKAVNRFRQAALAEDVSDISEEIITRTIEEVKTDRIKPTVTVQPMPATQPGMVARAA